MKTFFNRLSLSQQFLMVSFPVLLAGTLIVGYWIGQQLQDSVVHRIGAVTALFVDSMVAPQVRTLLKGDQLSASDQEAIAVSLGNTPLGQKILSLKIWRKDGYVLFSTEKNTMDQKLPVEEGLEAAFAGNIFSEISVRTAAQQAQHGQFLPRMIETYTPIHEVRTGKVLAVAELYQGPDEVDRDVAAAKQQSWLLVAGTTLTMYLLLFALVHRGSKTITRQQRELSDQVNQLTVLIGQNTELQDRVIQAAERATALNETFLRRISSDIHDGPGQDLGFALMQLKNIADAGVDAENGRQPAMLDSIEPTRLAVQSALTDLRAISSNLELPDIEDLGLPAIAERVVRDFQMKTGMHIRLDMKLDEVAASFRSKVTLYRLLQESLANSFRHAQCKDCSVVLRGHADHLTVEISDGGPGFDPAEAVKKRRLGLQSMRQRVEVLGGSFELTSRPSAGTLIRATLPLASHGIQHD